MDKQHTEVKQKQTSCVFDDQFFFDFNDMDRNKMEELLNVKVYDADMISRNDLIGHWGIDMTEVYFPVTNSIVNGSVWRTRRVMS